MIEFSSVTKTYPTGQHALTDVSFLVPEGDFVFFVGESGAGKTTVMRLLTKDLPPTSGSISFRGIDLNRLKRSSLPKLRREISVIFQDYKLLPDRTVAENIELALEIAGMKQDEIKKRITDLLQLVNLAEKHDFFPRQLSGGEAQRVSIARALAVGPKVIFADEPTGNLDHDTSMAIARLFEKINALGTTILMATHNQDIVKALKKREIHLHQGKLIKDTRPARKDNPQSETKEATEPKEKAKVDEKQGKRHDSPEKEQEQKHSESKKKQDKKEQKKDE